MTNLLSSTLGWLRIVAFLEGVSFLVLLGIAMPLKYMYDMPEMVRQVGMAHGLLFVAYVVLLLLVKMEKRWSMMITVLSFIASLVPFGTFYADWKWFREKED